MWSLNETRPGLVVKDTEAVSRICDLILLSADLITLQEVETEQFYSFFLPELKRDGYDGIFSPKSRAKTMTESERKHVDGCAIFWR